jgi:hypothetical protein
MYVVPALLALLTASSLVAQATVTAPTELRAAPQGAPIATVRAGAEVRVRDRRGALSRVTLEGYIHRDLIGGRRDSFALSVRAPSGARLRESPALNAPTIANLRDGMGLTQVSRRGEWVRVRRVAWIPSARLRTEAQAETREQAGSVETAQAPVPPPAPTRAPDPPVGNELTPTRQTVIRLAPQGDSIGGIRPGAVVVPLARERDWVRIRVEGWVRENELQSVDTAVQTRVSAADLRADPDRTRGVVVRWNVQVLSPIQRADPLRRELAENEPYVIARGPDTESALLYLAVPPSMLDAVSSIAPLTNVVVTARVRTGRSSPVGVPILDLVSIVRR